MRIAIAIVPFVPPFCPVLGGPLVTAELRERGHDAIVRDYALVALERLWSPDAMNRGRRHLRGVLDAFEQRPVLLGSEARSYGQAAYRLLPASTVLQEVEHALGVLRGTDRPTLDDHAVYDQSLEIVQGALALSSAPFAPEAVSLRRYSPPDALRSTSDVVAHARRSAHQSLFGPTLLDHAPRDLLHSFAERAPDAVGISVTWPEQLGPAAMLGQGLRDHGYDGPIVWGGALMAHIAGALGAADDIHRASLVDAVIPFGGADALHRLLDAVQRGKPWNEMDGIVVPGAGCRHHPRKKQTNRSSVDAMPTPVFDGLPLQRYLSPRLVLPLLASVGCYHKACTFCDHHHSSVGYRPRRATRVVADIRELVRSTRCRDFYFVDDCTPPATMRALAAELVRWRTHDGESVRWMTECRPEEALARDPHLLDDLAASGCEMLLFGMESADDEVLRSMGKKASAAQMTRVFKAVHSAGIKLWCFFMVGFPTEDTNAAARTRELIVALRDEIDVVAGGPFVVTRHSQLASNPSQYGIALAPPRRNRAKDRARKGKRKGKEPRPVSLELSIEHRGGRMSAVERDRCLQAMKDDPRLSHFLHPLVVEAHGLILERAYFHRVESAALPEDESVGPDVRPDFRVRAARGVMLLPLRFPVGDGAPQARIPPSPCALLGHLFRPFEPQLVSAHVAGLVMDCMDREASVDELGRARVDSGQGSRQAVESALAALVRIGYLEEVG